jgi:hypothetical protein
MAELAVGVIVDDDGDVSIMVGPLPGTDIERACEAVVEILGDEEFSAVVRDKVTRVMRARRAKTN